MKVSGQSIPVKHSTNHRRRYWVCLRDTEHPDPAGAQSACRDEERKELEAGGAAITQRLESQYKVGGPQVKKQKAKTLVQQKAKLTWTQPREARSVTLAVGAGAWERRKHAQSSGLEKRTPRKARENSLKKSRKELPADKRSPYRRAAVPLSPPRPPLLEDLRATQRPAAKDARSATLAARRRDPTFPLLSHPETIETKPLGLRLRIVDISLLRLRTCK